MIFKSLTVIPPRREFLQEFLQDSLSMIHDGTEMETIALH